MISSKIQFRPRYAETDQMGVVYHGNYAQYLEMGRIEWLRNLGISYKKMEKSGIMLPVINLNINYLKSAEYDDFLTLETHLLKLPTVKIEFSYKLFNENQELITTAETTLVFIDIKSQKPTRPPKYLIQKLAKLIG